MPDRSQPLAEQVRDAFNEKQPLKIVAGDSKGFYGHPVDGATLDVSGHHGVIDYHPSELVITVRSGTRLTDLQAILQENRQMLAFEPPVHSANSTIGGIVATALAGPRRVSAGGVRDFVLGVRILNGRGEILRFGGQVMKNVAGYDVPRLMTGAQGSLGVLLDISLKVLPLPDAETSLQLPCESDDIHRLCQHWLKQGLPLNASSHHRGMLALRLGSTANAVHEAERQIRKTHGTALSALDPDFWTQLRDQTLPFFRQPSLWRLSVPGSRPCHPGGNALIEWHGALRWQHSAQPLFEHAQALGGSASRYNLRENTASGPVFPPPSAIVAQLQQRLKQAFDPANILNPGRIDRTH